MSFQICLLHSFKECDVIALLTRLTDSNTVIIESKEKRIIPPSKHVRVYDSYYYI